MKTTVIHKNSNETEQKQIRLSNSIIIPEIIRMINEDHTVTLLLKGFSMRPFLEHNRDKAVLAKPKNIKIGMPVLAEIRPKQYVLHRIIDISGIQVTLRGDGNLNTESCFIQDIKAVAIGFYRKGRNKLDSTDGFKWKCYSLIWTKSFFIRRYLLAFYRKIWLNLFKSI